MAVFADSPPAESGMVMFEDSTGAQRPDCAVMDSSFSLTRLGPLMRFLESFSTLCFDTSTIHVPVFISEGETPMLVGKPFAKALGLSVDFFNHGGEWRAATLGRQPLTEDYDPSIAASPVFDLILEDEKGAN